MYRGRDLEFNSNTKLFYTNRSAPKKKITEAEMVEINSLYRVIGHCLGEIAKLQSPPATATAKAALDDTNDIAPGQAFVAIRNIPREKRILYGGIAIGVLIVLVVGLRLVRKSSG